MSGSSLQRMSQERELFDRLPADQVLLDDALEHLRGAGAVPDAVGVHDRDRPVDADAKAVGLGAVDAAVSHQSELLQPALQELPRLEAGFLARALRLGLVGAQEDVAADLFRAELLDLGPQHPLSHVVGSAHCLPSRRRASIGSVGAEGGVPMKRFIQHSELARDRRFIRQDNIAATVLSTLPDDVNTVVDVFSKLDPMIERSVQGTEAEPLYEEYGPGFGLITLNEPLDPNDPVANTRLLLRSP